MMLRCALLATLLLWPLNALAEQISTYQAAVAERLAGHPDAAARMLRSWLGEHPQDADAWLQLGYAELAGGRLDAAEGAFHRVLVLAPNYTDAQAGLDLVAKRRTERPALTNFVRMEGAISVLSGAQRDWREGSVSLHLEPRAETKLDFGTSAYQRFGLDDLELQAGFAQEVTPSIWLRGGFEATPAADFRPRWGVSGGLDWRLADRRDPGVIGLDASFQRFPAQDVVTVSPSYSQYFSDGRYAVTLRGTGVIAGASPIRVGGLLRGEWLPDERTRAFIGAGSGPDTELGTVTNVSSVFAGGEVPLSRKFSATAALSREWRSHGGGNRSEARLGIKIGL